MPQRNGIALLSVALVLLLFVIYLMPKSLEGNGGGHQLLTDQSLELRFRDSVGKFSQTFRDIEKRLQSIEEKLNITVTDEKNSKVILDTEGPKEDKEEEEFLSHITAGEIKQGSKCLDSVERGTGGQLELVECHRQGGNQYFEYNLNGRIEHKGFCLSVKTIQHMGQIVLRQCNDEGVTQNWEFTGHRFKLAGGEFCMASNGPDVFLKQCNNSRKSQKWIYKSNRSTV